jgi:tetratricopeptide (TPR) repeat protein
MLLDLAEGVGAEVTEPDRVAAEAIADRLAGLPIAIAAAGKNLAIARRSPRLRAGRATFAHYLERMGSGGAPGDLNHLDMVRSVWEASLRLIDRGEDLGPRAILDVISVLARGEVPIMLLGHLAPVGDSTASEEALDRIQASIMGLEQIGLVDLVDLVGTDPDETPMQPSCLQLHPVVGDAFRDAALAGTRAQDLLVRAVDAAHRRARAVGLGTAEREHLARHVTELTRYGSQLTVDALERLVRTGHEIGGALIGSNVELAVRTLESASTALGLIPDPPVDLVIGLRSHLGLGLDNWGRRDQAREQVAQALTLATDALGDDDPRTLRLRGQYALLNESVDDLAAVIERMESLLGRRNFETLVMRGNLAAALLRAERYSAAREQYERLLDIIEVQWPDDVESIVTCRRNLVRALMRENATAAALDNIERLIDYCREWGLSETDEYLADLVAFQSLLIQANDPRGDIAEVERAVERVCAALGRSHPRSLIALGDYMAALEHRGMYPRAEELSREIERELAHRFGESDHNSIVAAVNLVTLLEVQENHLEAEQLLERLEQNSRGALGADSPIHQDIRARLDTYRLARAQIPNWEARCRDDKVLLAGAVARDVVDNRSDSTATQRIVVRANLAEYLDTIGMAQDAAEIWSRLVVDHEYEAAPEYIRMRYAQYLKNTDRVDEAKSEYMHLVDRYADHDRTAELVSRLELAECHIASDEPDMAMNQLRGVREILETDTDTEFGDDARASSLHRLAGLLDQCGDRPSSAAAYERVLGMFADSDAELGRNFLTTYYNYRGLGVVRSPELSQRLEAILGHETVLSRIERGEISADSISRDNRQMIARLIGIVHPVHDPDEAGPASPPTADEATDPSGLIGPIAALVGLMVERGESDLVVLRLWEGTAAMIAERDPEEGVLQYRELLACHRYSGGPPSIPARRVSRAFARLLVDRECFFEAERLLHTISTPLGAEPTSDELAEKCEWVGALRAVERLPEAEGQARACLAAAEGRRGDAWGELRAKLHRELAGVLATLGRNSEAVEEFRACVDTAISQWGHNHHNTMHLYAVARDELALAGLTEPALNPSLDRIFRAR